MNSGVTRGIHHIFFPPWLDASFLEPIPYGYRRYAGYLSIFDHPVPQQFKRPAIGSFWGIGAGKSYEVGICFLIKLGRLSGSRSIVQGSGKLAFTVMIARSLYRTSSHSKLNCYGIFPATLTGKRENSRSGNDSRMVFSLMYDTLYTDNVFFGELNGVFVCGVHIPQAYHSILQGQN